MNYILLKINDDISSPMLIDFFKNLLGNNVDIKKEDNICSIMHTTIDYKYLYDALSSLIYEYDFKMYAYISRVDDIKDNYLILKDYFKNTILKNNIYEEHSFIMELVLNGIYGNLDNVVLGKYKNDPTTIEVLKCFLENNMNTSKTANSIYMHRNTLINKLDKFVQNTGYDIKKFNDAFIIYHLIKK